MVAGKEEEEMLLLLPITVIVNQPPIPVQRRLIPKAEGPDTAIEDITFANLLIVHPIIIRNPNTFVGLPKDQDLEDLAYPGFRAALESGFNFDLTLPIDQNKKRVQEWRDKAKAQTSALSPSSQAPPDILSFADMPRKTLMDSIFGAYKAHYDVLRNLALDTITKNKRKRVSVTSETSPLRLVPILGLPLPQVTKL